MQRKQQTPPTQPPRAESDNLCKRLAEQFPAEFAAWAFNASGPVSVAKTELTREPVRADAVILYAAEDTLHAEFQTTMKTEVPMPLRLLDYKVGLKRQNPQRRVRQVLIVLKQTGEEIPDCYEDEATRHVYLVIKMWEVEPQELLKYEGLLPLATLCRAESGEQLLAQVAEAANRLPSRQARREAISASRIFAGLRYHKDLVNRILKETDMLEESVIYQDILQRGVQRGLSQGLQQGLQQGEQRAALRLLERRFGKLSPGIRQRIEQLALAELDALFDALFAFQSKQDLSRWLRQHAPTR
jgi:predicted transposase YdaD